MTTYSELARRTGGVFRTAQLHASGATAAHIRSAVADGTLSRIRKGWLHTSDAAPELIHAVSLGGRLACVSAAKYSGLWTPDLGPGIHIARPAHAGRTFGDPTGFIEHWQSSTWGSTESAIESMPALLRQVLLCCEYEDALTMVDSALNQRRLTLTELKKMLATLPPRFSRVLDDTDPASESGLETLCRYRLRQLGLAVRSQVTFGDIGRVDLVLGDRVIIEADGRETHEGTFLRDRTRDLALMRRGYVVVRVGYHHVVNEWQLVEHTVRALVMRREHVWSATHRREGLVS
ncbi:very-short-patch-repair endonuclease [Leifsonia sp. AK011]|uniref:type IV toxin-antitoxin system AbiEi family antitoxin domain-containing protein n=1 Tax=Leifsonia sp. AK011 TaxID=2723075 RepID=UPI0015CDE6B9|nr:type IV toxin-antitoxin system AbiEi family antitoxin domain-containing protein [Leifsonia sp. AK011]NYF11256.1 very-short-patch-repair endonuclease [Leifsonia sp. AK011]